VIAQNQIKLTGTANLRVRETNFQLNESSGATGTADNFLPRNIKWQMEKEMV
jgi:hypothetical protein